ncbi:hypothetical protein CVT24_008296 [Panaeolus cyanescens]|uniref:Uncharacterized protein n=1 Tax=Panaeolus cyanescens TaxID=181874 RepID=A0A409W0Q4_9AGAR|nr:hypothetical protein CVT24_008296 [Panaeolus cyanescens]
MPVVRTGEVSIEQWSGKVPGKGYRILLLCATGSGKSSFIEAMAGSGHRLGISGGTLESVTQEAKAFKLVNIQFKWTDGDLWPVYLVDTPGFLDSKMSEVEIVKKLDEWQKKHDTWVHYVFYFSRITDTRIPGSARRLTHIIKTLGLDSKRFTIVTSMWDTICREETWRRAENHFAQLRDDIWEAEIQAGARIRKFENTHTSAIVILMGTSNRGPVFRRSFRLHAHNPIASPVYGELLDRIESARQEKLFSLEQQIHLISNPNHELESTVLSTLRDTDERLTKYISQLVAFGDSPPGFDIHPQSFAYGCLLDVTVALQQYILAIESELDLLPSLTPNSERRSELETTLQLAKAELERAQGNVDSFNNYSPGLKPLTPLPTATEESEPPLSNRRDAHDAQKERFITQSPTVHASRNFVSKPGVLQHVKSLVRRCVHFLSKWR